MCCVDDEEPIAYSGPIILATVDGFVLLDFEKSSTEVGFLSFGKSKSIEFIPIFMGDEGIDIFAALRLVGGDLDRCRVDDMDVQRVKIFFLSDTSLRTSLIYF